MNLRTLSKKRRNRTRGVVFSAINSALCLLLLFLGTVLGTADLSFTALAALLLWFLLLEYGAGYAFGGYLVTSLLAFLLLPDKGVALLFAGLVGWYPLVKRPLEKLPRPLAYLGKFLAVNAVCLLLWRLFRALLGLEGFSLPLLLLMLLLYNLAFFLFDIALTRLIWLYIRKFRGILQKAGFCKQ